MKDKPKKIVLKQWRHFQRNHISVTFASKNLLVGVVHKNDKVFQCRQCNSKFLRKSDLEKHKMIHSERKPFKCSICNKQFNQSSNMLTHQRRHSGIRPFSCELCGKRFYRKVDVRRHHLVHRVDQHWNWIFAVYYAIFNDFKIYRWKKKIIRTYTESIWN